MRASADHRCWVATPIKAVGLQKGFDSLPGYPVYGRQRSIGPPRWGAGNRTPRLTRPQVGLHVRPRDAVRADRSVDRRGGLRLRRTAARRSVRPRTNRGRGGVHAVGVGGRQNRHRRPPPVRRRPRLAVRAGPGWCRRRTRRRDGPGGRPRDRDGLFHLSADAWNPGWSGTATLEVGTEDRDTIAPGRRHVESLFGV